MRPTHLRAASSLLIAALVTGIGGSLFGCDDAVTIAPGGDGGSSSTPSSSSGSSDSTNILMRAQLGNPRLLSAQRLAFGPGGVLLVGDGRSDRIVAIETGDTSTATREENSFSRVNNLTGAAAGAIGTDVTAADLQISDIAVNPLSWRTYIAVTQYSTFEAHILTVDVNGGLRLFDLESVIYASVDVPPLEGSAALVADISWTDSHVISSITPQTFLRHELRFVETPFTHKSRSRRSTTRIFHRSFLQWMTELPMDHFFSYTREGERFVVGSFTSTVVRFEASELEDGANDEEGTTVLDFMDGRSVLDFLPYDQDDEMFVLVSLSNFLFDGEPGAVRVDGELFYQSVAVNEQSPILLDFGGNPVVPGVARAHDFDGVLSFTQRGPEHAVVLKANSLRTEELP